MVYDDAPFQIIDLKKESHFVIFVCIIYDEYHSD